MSIGGKSKIEPSKIEFWRVPRLGQEILMITNFVMKLTLIGLKGRG